MLSVLSENDRRYFIFFFFFFWWIKRNILIKRGTSRKHPQRIQEVYKIEGKNLYPLPNQSTKSTTEVRPETKNPLVHAHRLQSKTDLHPWIECSTFSRALLFLSFQTIQKRHKRAESHTFFLSFPTQGPNHPNNTSPIEEGSTHETPKREKSKLHKYQRGLTSWVGTYSEASWRS